MQDHGIENRVTRLEVQSERVASDIESEKRSRANANSEINRRLDALMVAQVKTERLVAVGTGIILALNAVLHFIR